MFTPISIKISMPFGLGQQTIISATPDMTPEQWKQLGQQLIDEADTMHLVDAAALVPRD